MGLCLGLPALANEAPVSFNGTSISLEQALERALRSNPELAAVGRETEIASGARQQAGLIPNPDLSWSVEDTRQGNRQTSVSIAQPLELGGARCAGGGGETRQRDRLDPTGSPSRRTAGPGPWRLLRGADRAGACAWRRPPWTWPGALQAADRRVKAGSISSVERVRAQVLADNAQLDLSQAELEQRTYVQLSSTWDEPQPGFARVGGALDAVPASITRGALLRHLDESPTLRLAAQEVARGEAQVDLEKRQRIPNLTVSIGSKYDQTARDGRGERVNLIGLSMPLPLFDRNQGNIYAAQSRADQARDLQRATLLRLRAKRTGLRPVAHLGTGAGAGPRPAARRTERAGLDDPRLRDGQVQLPRRARCPAHPGRRPCPVLRALDAAAQARVSMERLLGEDIGHLGQ
ncbi:Cobalt-zinc-cadmium resistance protein CzcC [Pseudomonas aeruginosa]|nr:Cobalt-zinc-cadmium resistance protein CzcC [Pseudomonas aeruginosa]